MKYELYKQYRGLIFKVIKDLNCQWETQEDWQELFDAGELGLIRAINKVEVDRINTRFFYAYIRNELLTYFYVKTMPKRYAKEKPISIDKEIGEDRFLYEVIPDDTNIEQDLIKKEQVKTIKLALNLLPPKYKDILIKYYNLGYDLRTIANDYNTSYQNIHATKKTALKLLKTIYLKLMEE